MADIVNTGATANDGSGDPLRTGFQLINQRLQELQGTLSYRGAWAAGTDYIADPARDFVTVGGLHYVTTSNHTSGASFAADLALGWWVQVDLLQFIARLSSNAGAQQVGTLDGRTVQQRLDALPSELDPAGTAADRVASHNQDINAHPGLVALVNAAVAEAEAARDAAIIGAGVYATEAAGRAAVADGVAFKVQGSGDVAAFEYRRVNSTTSTLIATYPAKAAVDAVYDTLDPVSAEFDIVPAKNLYNPALAENGFVYNFVGGEKSAFANSIVSGRVPVTEGLTYTFSQPSTESGMFGNVYCWDASGTYLGMAALQTTNAVVPGMGLTLADLSAAGGYRSVTFTVPVGSGVATVGMMLLSPYAVHTTDDFNRIRAATQLEVGAVATGLEPYTGHGKATLRQQATGQAQPALVVQRQGQTVYVRSHWSSTLDLIQRIALSTGTAFTNDTVNLTGARTALKTVTDTASAFNGGTVLASQGDDACPMNYNGTYIGANHGAFIVRETTATAHGKTVFDVGSQWTDGAARKWTIVRIVDANKLWLVSENLSVYPVWSFATAFTGTTLTHFSGATNTGAISIASSTTTQLWPAINAQSKRVLLDGVTEILADGTYRCNTLQVVEGYNITNPASVLSYVQSQVGSATQPALNHSSVAADVKRTITYLFAENGSCTITDGVQVVNALTIGYLGATQAGALNYSGKQLWQYMPRVTAKTNPSGTWDFQAQADISGTFELITLGSANWTDANNPPDRMAQIVKTAGVAEFGLMVGYSPRRSVGVPALRKTLVNTSGFISSLRKQYPYAVNVPALSAGTAYDIVAFRGWWNAADAGDASAFTWYRDGKSVIVVADFHQTVNNSRLQLPSRFVGMDVTVVDKSASLTLHGSGVVSAGGLQVSVSGGYGYGVFKLD